MTYNVEDKVWLNACNIQIYLLNKKLNSKHFESFQIMNKLKKQAYWFDISIKQQIYSVFNVLLLKLFKSSLNHTDQSQKNEFKDTEILRKLSSELHYEIKKLTNSKRNKNSLYYLVKWKNYEEFNNTWKSAENLQYLVIKIRNFYEANSTKSSDKNTAVNTQIY